MTLEYIFSKQYLFNSTPPAESEFYIYLLIFFGLIFIIGILFLIVKSWDKNIRMRQMYAFTTCGILGLLYIFARYERLPWLGSRLFLALVIVALLVWSTINAIWLASYSKKIENKKILAERYEKYLPKNKVSAKHR